MATDPLAGRVALVTGAGSGLGRASALALARAGAHVVLNDLDPVGLAATVAAVRAAGGTAASSVGDVSSPTDVAAFVELATARFGGLDVLHANAGVERYGPLEEMDLADMDRIIAVDLKGALLCARAVIAPMRTRGGGSIVFTSSVQATHSLHGSVVYAATKAGIVAAARTLALEVGPFSIRVNTVSPGTIDTPMLDKALEGMDLEGASDFRRRVEASNALGRIGTPEEVGAAVVFLASDAASYVTATDLVVDGGFKALKRF